MTNYEYLGVNNTGKNAYKDKQLKIYSKYYRENYESLALEYKLKINIYKTKII